MLSHLLCSACGIVLDVSGCCGGLTRPGRKRCTETINALQAFRKRNSDAKAALHQIKEQRTEVRLRSDQLHGASRDPLT